MHKDIYIYKYLYRYIYIYIGHAMKDFAAPRKAPHCFGRLARRPKRCLIVFTNCITVLFKGFI